ncbi:hypothetical protein C6A36_01090 [Desulfobacteraceae bacterium SEEP-SAG10]|nr:hypothetical protein C6A36_01090 [Desulfobacteraceae bacterium SEEP-SAG10]
MLISALETLFVPNIDLWMGTMAKAKPGHPRAYLMLQELFFYFKEVITDSINHLFEYRCSESQNLAEIF